MSKFRKKPVVIEAVRYDGTLDGATNIYAWINGKPHGPYYQLENITDGYMTIKTLEGTMRASPGDWIIKGVKNEFYPCKPDIFEATYEPVT